MTDITFDTLTADAKSERVQAIMATIGTDEAFALAVRLEINRLFDPAEYDSLVNPERHTANGFGVEDIENAAQEIADENEIDFEPGLLEKIVDKVLATNFWSGELENYSVADGNFFLKSKTREVMTEMGFSLAD